MTKNIVIIGAVVIVALAGLYYFMTRGADVDDVMNNDQASTTVDANNVSNTNGVGGRGAENSVVLAENETGNVAKVAEVTLTQPGFVAVYNVNSQGDTTLLGTSDLLTAGTHTDVTVQLDSVIARNQTLVATLHADDGDGKFEFPDSDFYLANGTTAIVSDVDVVDVAAANEDAQLQKQVETQLEAAEDKGPEAQ
jgi:hypothetical protein